MELKVGQATVGLVLGDITEQNTEAIVNAANSSLMGGGGVDGAIHRKGGPRILEECRSIRALQWPEGLPTGKAVMTGGGDLKARYVIHTVGPVWSGGLRGEPQLLADCYCNSLALAESRSLKTVAFPSISTGAFGYPIKPASRVALGSVKNLLEEGGGQFRHIVFVLFTPSDLKSYETAAAELFRSLP